MKLRNLLTAGLTAMALFTAGCVGGGDSANKMDTPKEGPVELQVSAAASLTDAMKELGGMYEKEHGNTKLVFNFGSSHSFRIGKLGKQSGSNGIYAFIGTLCRKQSCT